MTYSIAIRTLGTAGEKFRQELESIARQTLQPERVLVYVADTCGVKFVDRVIGMEEYRYVPKGMVAQRALAYEEITSEYLLLLDDDVELAPNSAERLLQEAERLHADAVGADIFRNQEMPLGQKVFAVLTNWVVPHWDPKVGYRVLSTGGFSYCMEAQGTKPTEKLDGPCVMWRKEVIGQLHWEQELWMDRLSEFAYGDDWVESYKAFVNGFRLYLLYDSGVVYLNAKTASSAYHHTHKKFYIRSLMSAMIWYRCIYEPASEKGYGIVLPTVLFATKCMWLLLVNILAGVLLLDLRIPGYYLKGLREAWSYARSEEYRKIEKYQR